MKHFKQFLLVVLVALASCVRASAYDFEVDGIYYTIISTTEMTCKVSRKDNSNACYKDMEKIVIPESVTYQGPVYSRTFTVTELSNNCFEQCWALREIVLPPTITHIPLFAFQQCTGMTEFNIPASITSIGYGAFCDSGLKSITIPASVNSIGDNAFYACKNLTRVNLPEGIKVLPSDIFAYCTALETIGLPESLKEIGGGAFEKCDNLKEIVLPSKLTFIGSCAFRYCGSLQSIIVPDEVTEIGDQAFAACLSMKKLTLGKSVKKIEYRAFTTTPSLAEIISLNPKVPELESAVFDGASRLDCIVKVPAESLKEYQASAQWQYFTFIVALDETTTDVCKAPSISVVDGKVMVSTDTSGAICHTSITCEDSKSGTDNEIELSGVYHITSYATADGKYPSENVHATLVWVTPILKDQDNILSMEAKKAVLIRSNGNSIVVSGTDRGEKIELYTIGGVLLNSVSAKDDETIIPSNLQKGEVVIIKYGDKSIKCKL